MLGALPWSSPQPAAETRLAELAVDDLLAGLGLANAAWARRPARLLLNGPATRFARQLATFDSLIGAVGVPAGGRYLTECLARRLVVRGAEELPAEGPLVVVANHPGLLDGAALFAAIGRDDLQVVAAERPFLDALPHLRRHLFSLGETPFCRAAAVRAAAQHVKSGGALLTFPAGAIEPDPAAQQGAELSLAAWAPRVELLARAVGDAVIVPAAVSGVLSPRALALPITRLRRAEKDRHWLAAVLQVMRPALQDVTVRVRFGPAIEMGEPRRRSALVEAAMRELLRASAGPN
ncbi:MAG: 1-acyl-sn-glycerol-3-phosphate acyltransferase [Geminicoccaceae bacterium]